MKKLMCLLLLLSLMPTAYADAPGTDASVAFVVTDSPGERLNLRTGPDGKYDAVGKYYAGVQVELLGEYDNGFARIRIGDTEGWADEKYLSLVSTASEMPQCVVSNNGGTGANLRTKPSKIFGKVKTLYPNGTPVQVMGLTDDGWLHVTIKGETGYILASLVNLQLSFVDKIKQEYIEPGSVYVSTGHKDTMAPVYREPDISSALVAELPSKTMVIITTYAENGWAHIWMGRIEGWMQTAFLDSLDSDPVNGAKAIACLADESGGCPVYTEAETGEAILVEPAGTIFHVSAVVPRGWVYGWTEHVSQSGFVRAENLSQPLYTGDRMYVMNPDEGDRLNLRTAPLKSAEALAKFWNGMEVWVTAYNADHSWAKVVAGDLQGWMDMSYLTYEDYAERRSPVSVRITKQVKAQAAPMENSWSPMKLDVDTLVHVLGITKDGWVYVACDQNTGWVKQECIEQIPAITW